ncbi:AraC family transcriptional regulator [Actinomycetes bacterium KLBMP 9759]
MVGATLLFASNDMEEVRAFLGQRVEPDSIKFEAKGAGGYRLSLVGGSPARRVDEGLSLFRIDVEPEIRTEVVSLPDAYTVSIGLSGRQETALDNLVVPTAHCVASPGQELHATLDGASKWMLRLGRATVERALQARLGDHPGGAVRFEPTLRADDRAVADWMRMLGGFAEFSRSTLLGRSPLAAGFAEQMLVHGLLDAQRHTFTAELAEERGPADGPALRAAIAFCDAQAPNPITVADIAAAARLGVRSLQRAFQDELGMTPMEYLRRVRMERARAELLRIRAGDVAGTVTDVAFAWGFVHLGRFSSAYRARYGETPSQTIRGAATD